MAAGADLWEVMCRRYGIGLDIVSGSLGGIPREGPLVVVANHPYGILDGLVLGRVLSERRRGDFRVLAHRVFTRAPGLDRIILPVSFYCGSAPTPNRKKGPPCAAAAFGVKPPKGATNAAAPADWASSRRVIIGVLPRLAPWL